MNPYLRAAVVQIDYHPAVVVGEHPAREDPIFRFGASSFDHGGARIPLDFEQALRELRSRVCHAHDRHLLGKVRAILETCRSWQVQLVVFPEYAIPWELLAEVADAGGDMVVVAGTHQVVQQGLGAGVYATLGWEQAPEPGWAVCPVLYRGKLIGLQPKLRPIEGEPVTPGRDWAPVTLPSGFPSPLAVETCRDFLEAFGHGTVAERTKQEEQCKLLAVPSYTPTSSLGSDFDPLGSMRARRYGRPVLYANIAKHGGSALWTDEKGTEGEFPEHAGRLPAGCEGVIVADIDVEPKAPGASTRYDGQAVVKPVAAATLVYRAHEADDAYARWLADARGRLDAGDASGLASFGRAVQEAAESLRGWGDGCEARRRRLDRLRAAEHLTRAERALQLLREVVVPDSVLPLDVLRRAMARGAAEMVLHWLSHDEKVRDANFADVERGLRAAGETKLAGFADAGKAVIAGVVTEVRGDVPPPHPGNFEAILLVQQKLLRVLGAQLSKSQDEAIAHFEARRFEAALHAFEQMLTEVQEAGSVAPDDPLWRSRESTVRSNIASCLLALQRIDEARDVTLAIDLGVLDLQGKALVAAVCTQVGEIERADAIVRDLETEVQSSSHELVREARQLVALARGEIPERLGPSPQVRLRVATILLDRGELGEAVELVLDLSPKASKGALIALNALAILTAALQRTVLEIGPIQDPVPRDVRGRVVHVVEGLLRDLRAETLPTPLALEVEQVALAFYGIAEDHEFARQAILRIGALGGVLPVREQTLNLARDGQLHRALASLPDTGHPWRRRLERAELLAEAGEKDRSLEELRDLAVEFPGRPPIESLLSKLLLHRGQEREALFHAEEAFDGLPGRGQRIALARASLEAGEPRQAWYVLRALADSQEPNVLGLRAAAAEFVSPGEAVGLWQGYLQERPDDGSSRVRLARLLHILNLPGAAEEAWEAFRRYDETSGEITSLDVADLFACGLFQRLHESNRERREERIRAIADALRGERFRDDPEAEAARVRLHTESGLNFGSHPPNWRVLERGGFARKVPVDGIAARLRGLNELHEAWLRWYRSGGLPFSGLARLSGQPAARLLAKLIRASERGEGGICASFGERVDSLEDVEVLVSDLELLVLAYLEALDGLRQSLGSGGKLLLFENVHERMLQEAGALAPASGHDDSLRRMERAFALIHGERETPGEGAAHLVMTLEGEARGCAVSFASMVEELCARAAITVAQKEAALRFIREHEQPLPFPAPAPETAWVTFEVLQLFIAHDLLDAVAEAFPSGLLVSATSKERLRREIEERRDERTAWELAQQVQAFVARGLREKWVEVIHADQDIADIPPPRVGDGNDFIRLTLLEMVQGRVVLERRPKCLLLTSDFFGTGALTDDATIRALDWPDIQSLKRLSARLHRLGPRTTSPSRVVALQKNAKVHLRRLAGMGVKDAVTSGLLLGLMEEYGRIDTGEPKALLDRAEWTLREPRHLAGALGVVHAAGRYAESIWQAFCSEDAQRLPRDRAATFAVSLLARAEAVDQAHPAGAVDGTLALLAEHASDRPGASYVPSHDHTWTLSDASPAAELWSFLREWAGSTGGRAASLGRALRRAWLQLDDDPREGDPRLAALMVAGETVVKTHRGLELTSSSSGAVATLSALWSDRPLGLITLGIQFPDGTPEVDFVPEDALRFGAALLKNSPKSLGGNEAGWRFEYTPREGSPAIPVVAPPEAVMLRAEPEVLAAIAPHWLAHMGVLDGRFHDILMKLADDPNNQAARRSFARLAMGGPWRLVREDPSYLRFWGGDAAASFHGAPRDLAELEAMLAEPTGEIDADGTLLEILGKRINDGFWLKRPDREKLALQALKIPGALLGLDVVVRKSRNDEQEVREALWNLDHPDECSCGTLAADITLLRHVAASHPLVELGGSTVDLREILPLKLQTAVETERRRAFPSVQETVDETLFVREGRGASASLAESEAAILRVCRSVVGALAHRAPVSPRRGTWLTWRLFQWLSAQLDTLSPGERAAGIDALRKHDPGPAVDRQILPKDDLLDPVWFDPRGIRHRLAAVLYAIGVMEDIAMVTARADDNRTEGVSVAPLSTDGLQKLLGELAGEEPTALEATFATRDGEVSSLGWDLPVSIPGLALLTLLRLDLDGIRHVPESAIVRHIETIPTHADMERRAGRFAYLLIAACAFRAGELGAEAREALARKLAEVRSGDAASLWRALGFASLFAAGDTHLRDDARAEVEKVLAHEMAPKALGMFLLGIAQNPSEIAPAVHEILGRAERLLVDAVALAAAVGQVVLEGTAEARDAARCCLRELASREPYKHDDRFAQLLEFLAIPVDP